MDAPLHEDAARRANAGAHREAGRRRTHLVSSWALAAALVGVGATSAAIAHAVPSAVPAAGVTATSGAGAQGATPRVGGVVATSSGSVVPAPAGTGSPGVPGVTGVGATAGGDS